MSRVLQDGIPDGTPFWGEALKVSISTVAGTFAPYATFPYGWDIGKGIGTGSPPVMASGDAAVAAADYSIRYLMAGDVAVMAWVIELGPGSAGTLALHDGLSSAYDGTDLTVDLGTHAITGATTLAVATSSFTVADLIDYFDGPSHLNPQLLFACTAGSVGVAQVRLRVWPPGGALGQFTLDAPAYELSKPATFMVFTATNSDGTSGVGDAIAVGGGTGDYPALWVTATTAAGSSLAPTAPWVGRPTLGPGPGPTGLENEATTGVSVTSGPTGGGSGIGDPEVSSQYSIDGVLVYPTSGETLNTATAGDLPAVGGPPAGTVEGVDWIVPPDSIGHIRSTGQQGTPSWVDPYAQVSYAPPSVLGGLHDTSAVVHSAAVADIDAVLTYDLGAASWQVHDLTLPTSGTSVYGSATGDPDAHAGVDLPLTTGPGAFVVSMTHSIAVSDPAYLGYGSVISGPDTWSDYFLTVLGHGIRSDSDYRPISRSVEYPSGKLWAPAGVKYLRNHSRTDGLGGNAPRNYNVTSVESSLRNFGYW